MRYYYLIFLISIFLFSCSPDKIQVVDSTGQFLGEAIRDEDGRYKIDVPQACQTVTSNCQLVTGSNLQDRNFITRDELEQELNKFSGFITLDTLNKCSPRTLAENPTRLSCNQICSGYGGVCVEAFIESTTGKIYQRDCQFGANNPTTCTCCSE